jgi:hypothetical protein
VLGFAALTPTYDLCPVGVVVAGTSFVGFAALVARIRLRGGILAPVPGPPASSLPWPRGGPA